ncbi:MAG: acyltransferase, partial [Rhodothermales bacterium]
MSRRKLESIQVLRGLAALMVVLVHIGVTEARYGANGYRWLDGFVTGNAGVDIFFVISGFIMIYTSSHRAGSVAESGRFLVKRVVRIYPTYWVYFFLVLAAWLIVPQWVNSSATQESNLLASFLLYPAEGYPLLLVAWTLEFEMVFYLLFTGALLVRERYVLPCILAVMVGLIAAGQIVRPESDAATVLMSPILSEFAVGCVLGYMHLRRTWKGGWFLAAAGALLLLLEIFGISWVSLAGLAGSPFDRSLSYGLAAILLVHGLVSVERESTIRFPRLALSIGMSSYSLYLSHVLVLSALGRIWQALGLDVLPNLVFVSLLLVAAVLWGLISFRWIEKPLVDGGRRLVRIGSETAQS